MTSLTLPKMLHGVPLLLRMPLQRRPGRLMRGLGSDLVTL